MNVDASTAALAIGGAVDEFDRDFDTFTSAPPAHESSAAKAANDIPMTATTTTATTTTTTPASASAVYAAIAAGGNDAPTLSKAPMTNITSTPARTVSATRPPSNGSGGAGRSASSGYAGRGRAGAGAGGYSQQDDRAFRSALEPDEHSGVAKRLSERFRTTLTVLLTLYVVVYLLENTVGSFSPTGPDMVLLFLGWYAQDNYRLRALKLYTTLSSISIVIDILGFVTTIMWLTSRSYPTWVWMILIFLFVAETVFKIATIAHAYALRKHLEMVDRLPVESALLDA